jgi:hypothetical protein
MKRLLVFTLAIFCLLGGRTEAARGDLSIDKVSFDICLAYAVCSFNFPRGDRKELMRAGFFHDKVVVRMKSLGNMTYIDQCDAGVVNLKEYVWQETMLKIAKADHLRIEGRKFRSTLEGTVFIDNVNIKNIVKEILAELNQC